MSALDVPLTLLDPEGGWINAPVHVHDLHGRPVLLHFWNERESFSPGQLPRIPFMLEEFVARGLQVISVHVPVRGESLERAMDTNLLEARVKRLGIRYPVAVDDGSMAAAYRVEALPSYLVFDGSLRLRLRVTGEDSLEYVLRSILERLTLAEGTASAPAP